jgi:hypothetical protein
MPADNALSPFDVDTRHARLPALYEEARAALSRCASIDECQEWANKAEAIASYAKQARDSSLRDYADRIKARAVRRSGELLTEFDARGKREGDHLSRTEAAAQAGLSEHQRKQAVRVANITARQFEEAVEGDNPPTVTSLAKWGRKPRSPEVRLSLGSVDLRPEGWRRLVFTLERVIVRGQILEPHELVQGAKPQDLAYGQELVRDAMDVLGELAAALDDLVAKRRKPRLVVDEEDQPSAS